MIDLEIPAHLGGHLDFTNNCPITLKYLVDKYKIRSMLDVGCGPMGVVHDALELGVDAYGVDGDFKLLYYDSIPPAVKSRLAVFDFTVSAWKAPARFDLIWTVEVAEHIEERYTANYLTTIDNNIRNGGILLFTHATPDQGGHHHVNEQLPPYWTERITELAFFLLEEDTAYVRQHSSVSFIRKTGMVFRKNG